MGLAGDWTLRRMEALAMTDRALQNFVNGKFTDASDGARAM